MISRLLAAVLVSAVLAPARAAQTLADPEASSGFGFCASPVRPACVDDARTYSNPSAIKRCDAETNRYLASVFKYRDCMYAQIEGVIRRTNETADLFKCRAARRTDCR